MRPRQKVRSEETSRELPLAPVFAKEVCEAAVAAVRSENRIVHHPQFGRGVPLRIDRETYSLPFVIAQFEVGVICRPACEFSSLIPVP